jgi:hypothetical protein
MGFTVTITEKPTYLHAVITGENSAENVRSYLQQVQRECELRQCPRVLIEERLEGPRLGIVDVYRIVSEKIVRALGQVEVIAYVDVHAEGDLMKFAEDLASNRIMPVAVFSNVSDAELWLQHLPAFRGRR